MHAHIYCRTAIMIMFRYMWTGEGSKSNLCHLCEKITQIFCCTFKSIESRY